MDGLTLGEAARALGVSADTLRRWDRAGKLRTIRDDRNRRRVPESEVTRLSGRPLRAPPSGGQVGAGLKAPALIDEDTGGGPRTRPLPMQCLGRWRSG